MSYIMCFLFLAFFMLVGTYKFWTPVFEHIYLLPLPTLFWNTINLKTLGFGGLTKECLWPNTSANRYSMMAVYVATRSQLCDAVFLLKFLWSFYKPLPATTYTCLIACLVLLLGKFLQTLHVLNSVLIYLRHAWGRLCWWAHQLIFLPLHFWNFRQFYQRQRQKRKNRTETSILAPQASLPFGAMVSLPKWK